MVRLTDRPDMTLDVYRGRKTKVQQQQQNRAFTIFTKDNNFLDFLFASLEDTALPKRVCCLEKNIAQKGAIFSFNG